MYLGILASKAMPIQIERITPILGPSPIQLTLPLDSTECSEMPAVRARGYKVIHQNVVQLLHCPPIPGFHWNGKVLSMILCYPFCKLGRKPSSDGVSGAVRVGYPLRPLGAISTRYKTLFWMRQCFMRSSFQ